jgi:hypothetical protein
MPGGDGTGPAGMGLMTGRGAGYCAGYPVPGFINPTPGRGFWGWGRGRGGWGRRNWFYATGLTGWRRSAYGYPGLGAVPYGVPYLEAYGPAVTPQQEAEMLRGQAEYLEDVLEGIKKRMEELESRAAEK